MEKENLYQSWDAVLQFDTEEAPDVANTETQNTKRYIAEHHPEILQAILEEAYGQYPQWKEDSFYDLDNLEEQMPDLEHPEDLLKFIRFKTIQLMDVQKEKQLYYAVNFVGLWDESCELWCVMHKDRVVFLGEREPSQLTWIAENDSSHKEFEEIKSQKKMACNIRF